MLLGVEDFTRGDHLAFEGGRKRSEVAKYYVISILYVTLCDCCGAHQNAHYFARGEGSGVCYLCTKGAKADALAEDGVRPFDVLPFEFADGDFAFSDGVVQWSIHDL